MRRWIAMAVVAPWAAWAIARTVGLDRVHPLIAFAAFTPYAALTAPLVVLVAAVLRGWAAALVALTATVLLGVAVLPRGLGDPGNARGRETVTVMTSNLYGGRGDAARVAALVDRYDVDVLALQELTPEALERLDRAGLAQTLRHRDAEPLAGGRGNGILSRHPLSRAPDWSEPREPAADAALPGGERLRVRVTHPFPPVRRDQAREWRQDLEALPTATERPAVIAGDFNATLDHRALRGVLDRGWSDAAAEVGQGLKPTWPVGRRILGLTIDHVLASDALEPLEVHVHAVPGSDHRAVVARLAVRR
jgi:endonuclease/exonuclease/phosphatase (EEP) superfamily protein YafD